MSPNIVASYYDLFFLFLNYLNIMKKIQDVLGNKSKKKEKRAAVATSSVHSPPAASTSAASTSAASAGPVTRENGNNLL
jgi:hypothetical protein